MDGKGRQATKLSILGATTTVAVALASFFLGASDAVVGTLLIALVGIAVTLLLDHRVQLAHLDFVMGDIARELGLHDRIAKRAVNDPALAAKEYELRAELSQLGDGIYHLRSLAEVYLDDIESIGRLQPGEVLLSTCPVPLGTAEDVVAQLTDTRYESSIAAHVAAGARGVDVTRIYLLQSQKVLDEPFVRDHLAAIARHPGIEIRVILRDETRFEGESDFLVFGECKVSIGQAEPGAGVVTRAIVHTDRAILQAYAAKYARLKIVSKSLPAMVETG